MSKITSFAASKQNNAPNKGIKRVQIIKPDNSTPGSNKVKLFQVYQDENYMSFTTEFLTEANLYKELLQKEYPNLQFKIVEINA